MGLDQYAFAQKNGDKEEIMYWRKHADLAGWMADLYYARGGEGDFNCVQLKLHRHDIEKLEKDHEDLEVAEGFFWGESRPEHIQDTKRFISLAYEALHNGREVYYTSWW